MLCNTRYEIRDARYEMRDTKYMLMALDLARRGVGSVEPNPAVGCIIVGDGRILGQGWHEKFGGPHAEINALTDCGNNENNPANSTMYVTFEPCCHHGKTGPCTDDIIKAKIGKVVVAIADPFTKVGGKGIEQLRRSGIEVEVGLCADQAAQLNAPFIKHAKTGRSWVILKWAQSTDGKMAWADRSKQRWISNEQSREDVHKLRGRVQAILIGINTVIDDDPLLTARPTKPIPITRIVLDTHLRIPLKSQLLETAQKSPVVIATSHEAVDKNKDLAKAIEQKGAELLVVPLKNDSLDLQYLVQEFGGRSIAQLLVEGGPTVHSSFLKAKLADQVIVYISPETLGPKGSIDIAPEMQQFTKNISQDSIETKHFGKDIRICQIINYH